MGADEIGPPFRVLVVDDNRDAADSAATLLHLSGFEPLACYSGADALLAAPGFGPGVCLIDLNMPGMDGDVLARRLRDALADDRVLLVAVTAQSDDEARRRIAAAGFHLHLVKPVDPRDLLAVVDAQWRLWVTAAAPTVPVE